MHLKWILSIFLYVSSSILFANTITHCGNKQVVGNYELIYLENEHVTLKAKLDTGASMSSLCAENIKIYSLHGANIINFSLCGIGNNKEITKPIYKFVKVRARTEENSVSNERPVILLKVKLGNQIQTIPINLTNRSQFHYPMLLGKDALIKFNVIIDPSR